MESTSNFNSRHLICLLFLLAGFGLFAENPVPITPGTQGTPINDNACNAIALSVNTLTTFENYTASKQSGEPLPPNGTTCTAQDGWCISNTEPKLDATVWFSFVAPNSSCLYIETTGFDSQLAIYEMSRCDDFRSYQLLAANDNPNANYNTARIENFRNFTPGNTYYIQVDGFEGATSQNATIEIFDCPSGPVARCKDLTVEVNPSTSVTIDVSDIDNNSLNWVVGRVIPETFDCSNEGSNTVSIRIQDADRNVDECTATVMVEAKGPPAVSCQDITVSLPGTGVLDLAATNLMTDNCAVSSVQYLPNVLNAGNLGENSVMVRVYDENQQTATCSGHVNLIDDVPPVITCPGDLNLPSDPTYCGAVVNYTLPTATDNSGQVTLELYEGFEQGAFIPGGTHTITYRATDAAGNVSFCSFEIVVRPSDNCPLVVLEHCPFCMENGTVDVTVKVYAPHLVISEVVTGTNNDKYVEVFNPTPDPVSLADYELRIYENGSSTPTQTYSLGGYGTLPINGVKVFGKVGATLYQGTVSEIFSLDFDGNDAIVLHNSASGYDADIFGVVGQNPGGGGWTSGSLTTVNSALIRKKTILGGITTSPTGSGSSGFSTLALAWNGANVTSNNLGSHAYEPSYSIQNNYSGGTLVGGTNSSLNFTLACDQGKSIGIGSQVQPIVQDGPPFNKSKYVTNVGTIVDLRMDKAACLDQVLNIPNANAPTTYSLDFNIDIDFQDSNWKPNKTKVFPPEVTMEEMVFHRGNTQLSVDTDWNVLTAKYAGSSLNGDIKLFGDIGAGNTTTYTLSLFTCGASTTNQLKCGEYTIGVNRQSCLAGSPADAFHPVINYMEGGATLLASGYLTRNDLLLISGINWNDVAFIGLINSCGQIYQVPMMNLLGPANHTMLSNPGIPAGTVYCEGDITSVDSPTLFNHGDAIGDPFWGIPEIIDMEVTFSISDANSDCEIAECGPLLAIGDVTGHVKFFDTKDDVNGAKTIPVTEVEDYFKPDPLFTVAPNPFQGSTTLSFTSPEATDASIQVFNMQGKLIQTLFEGAVESNQPVEVRLEMPQGSGLYFARVVTAGGEVLAKRLVQTR